MSPVVCELVAALTAIASVSTGTAVVGLYARPGERWRHFWFMSGLWGLIDGLIAVYVLLDQPTSDLVPILRFNTGLDVVYVLVGLGLWSRPSPRMRGFGSAVVLQGTTLFILDCTFWQRLA